MKFDNDPLYNRPTTNCPSTLIKKYVFPIHILTLTVLDSLSYK